MENNLPTQTTAKPFLKWAGGKRQLLPEIVKRLPLQINTWKNFTFVEPFVGSGAVLFYFLRNFNNLSEVIINDQNPDLINAYKTIKNNPKELIKELKKIKSNYFVLANEAARKDFFYEKRIVFNTRSLNDIKHTALLIFINKTCFNGLYRVNSKGGFNVPFGKYKKPNILDEATILADSAALQKVNILCGDFTQTIDYVNNTPCIFYFDPPYKPISKTASFNAYATNNFDDTAQIRLKEFCDKVHQKNYHFLLSNSDLKNEDPENNFFDNLYRNYQIERILAKRSINSVANKRGAIYELLISN